jgi:hypothetical protein
MARRTRRQNGTGTIDVGQTTVTTGNSAVGHHSYGETVPFLLNTSSYDGYLWFEVKATSFASTIAGVTLNNSSLNRIKYYIRWHICTQEANSKVWTLATHGIVNGDNEGWRSAEDEPVHSVTLRNYKICFDIIYDVTQFEQAGGDWTPTSAQKLATFEINTYGDKDLTTRLNPVGQAFDISTVTNVTKYIPVYSCAAQDAIADTDRGKRPLYCPEAATKHPWFKVPKGTTQDYPEPGQWFTLNLTKANRPYEKMEVAECYYAGDETTVKPADGVIIDPNQGTTTGIPGPDKLKYWSKCDAPRRPEDVNGKFLAPGCSTLKLGSMGGDCAKECKGAKDAFHMHDKNVQALSLIGFSCGFTQTTFSKGLFRVAKGNTVSETHTEDDVVWGAAVTAAHHVEPLFALPDQGAGTRASKNFGAELTMPYDKPTFFKKIQFYAAFESTMQRQWEVSKVMRGAIRRSFGAADEENLLSTGSGGKLIVINPKTGLQQQEHISVLNAQQVELAVKEIVTHSSTATAGISIDDLLNASITFSHTQSSWDEENYFSSSQGKSASWSLSSSMDIAGLSQWIAMDPNRAIDDDGFKAWKDSFHISMDLGGGNVSQVSSTEYNMTVSEDGKNVEVDRQRGIVKLEESVSDSKLLQMHSMSVSYNVEMWNGWSLNISPPNLVQAEGGVNCLDPAEWTYDLAGNPEDKIRWTVGYAGGQVALGVSASLQLIADQNADAGGIRQNALFGPGATLKDVSCFLDVGLNVTAASLVAGQLGDQQGTEKGAVNLFSPSAAIRGKVKGINYSMDTIQGTGAISKTWKKNYADNYKKFLNQESGDKLEMQFSIRSDFGDPNGPVFNAGADIQFRKTVVEFGEVGGRLVIEANAWAQIIINQTTGTTRGGRNAGFGLVARMTWENNVLEWFGLPFNLHPGISFGVAANLMFGGYTKQANAQGILIAEKKFDPSFKSTFTLGPLTWGYATVDTFRNELKIKHKSIFRAFGLGSCPILNVLGKSEAVWEYILRVAPFRAIAATQQAAQICAGKREQKFYAIYQKLKSQNLALPTVLLPEQVPQAGLPLCGGGRGLDGYFDITNGIYIKIKGGANGRLKLEKAWKNKYGKTLQEAINENGLIPNAAGAVYTSPYPCKLTKAQLILLTNFSMASEFDNGFDRCACVRREFKKLSSDKYYGRTQAAIGYDFSRWNDELEGDQMEQGVLTRGMNVIDSVVLDFMIAGRDPTCDERGTGEGECEPDLTLCKSHENWNAKNKDSQCTNAWLFANDVNVSIANIVAGLTFTDPNDKQKIQKAIAANWPSNGASQWWNNEGICGGFYVVGKWVAGVALWLPNKLKSGLFSFLGLSKDANLLSELNSAAMDKSNPCKVYRRRGPGGGAPTLGTDKCYDVYRDWTYYKEIYKPVIEWLDKQSSGEAGLAHKIVLHSKLTSKNNIHESYWSQKNCRQIPAHAVPHEPNSGTSWAQGPKTVEDVRDYVKAYCTVLGDNLEWLDNSEFGAVGGGYESAYTFNGEAKPTMMDFKKCLGGMAQLSLGPKSGTIDSNTACAAGYVFLNGADNGTYESLPIRQIDAEPVKLKDVAGKDIVHPCWRGYTDGEDEDALTHLVANFDTVQDRLRSEIAETSESPPATLNSSGAVIGTDTSLPTVHYKSFFGMALADFDKAVIEAKAVGHPTISFTAKPNAIAILSYLSGIIADPQSAVEYPFLGAYWDKCDASYGNLKAAHAAYVTTGAAVMSSHISKAKLVTAFQEIEAFDAAIEAIDLAEIGLLNSATFNLASKSQKILENYSTAWKEYLRAKVLHQLCESNGDGDTDLLPWKAMLYSSVPPMDGCVIETENFGVYSDARAWGLLVYKAIFGTDSYGERVPSLSWLSSGGKDLVMQTYSDAGAVRINWGDQAKIMMEAIVAAIASEARTAPSLIPRRGLGKVVWPSSLTAVAQEVYFDARAWHGFLGNQQPDYPNMKKWFAANTTLGVPTNASTYESPYNSKTYKTILSDVCWAEGQSGRDPYQVSASGGLGTTYKYAPQPITAIFLMGYSGAWAFPHRSFNCDLYGYLISSSVGSDGGPHIKGNHWNAGVQHLALYYYLGREGQPRKVVPKRDWSPPPNWNLGWPMWRGWSSTILTNANNARRRAAGLE